MKKNILMFFLILFISMTVFAGLGIIEPHPGVVWCKGKTYEINWVVLGENHPASKLRLYNAANTVKILNIMDKVPTFQGFFSWKVPVTIPDGKYVIRIKTLDNKTFSSSMPFIIKSCGSSSPSKSKIEVISPAAGDVWYNNKTYQIRWNFSGKLNHLVKIRLYRKNPKQKIKVIANAVPLFQKVFNWKLPQDIPEGNYFVRIKTIDNKVYDDSNVFVIKSGMVVLDPNNIVILNPSDIQKKLYEFYSPTGGTKWVPMKYYQIYFKIYKKNMRYAGWPNSWIRGWRVKLVSLDEPLYKPFLIGYTFGAHNKYLISPSKYTSEYEEYNFQWKFEPYYNIPSGKYKLMLESMANPSKKFYSSAFFVVNKISSNTGFIQGKTGDINIVDVYFDYSQKALFAKIKNSNYPLSDFKLYAGFKNSLHAAYAGNPNCKAGNVFSVVKNLSLKTGELKTIKLTNYHCFDHRPADFIPILGPLKYNVSIVEPISGKTLSKKSGYLCKTKKSDIIIRQEIMFVKNSGYYSSLYHNGKGILNISNFKKVPGGFEAYVDVDAENYGCSTRKFRIGLFADGPYLDGKEAVSLGWFVLSSGESRFLRSKNPIKFTFPKDGQYHRIVLIADPEEEKNEGYPNSYMNNFVRSFVKVMD